MPAPSVILDLSPVVNRKAGLGTYARRLSEHLLKEFGAQRFAAFHYGAPGHVIEPLQAPLSQLLLKTIAWSALRWRLSVLTAHWAGASREQWVTTQPTSPQSIFHATEHLLPPFKHMRSVFTFHDAIYALFPQFHTRKNLWYLNTMMPRFLRQASAIIAVSECSKRDCIRLYGVPAQKISVIPEAADPAWRPINNKDELQRVREKYKLPEHYVLALGTLEPRKNLVALLEAFKACLESPEDSDDGEAPPHLVIAGKKGWMYAPIFEKVKALGLEARVSFTDYVPMADAPALMSAARMFVLPSLYEGFGLPVLEAMQCGAPVLCSNTSSLPEVAGDAALMFDPRDAATMTRVMRDMWRSRALRMEYRHKGMQQAKKFSWQRAATETMRVYEKAVDA